MKINLEDLRTAARSGLLSDEQAQRLWVFLTQRQGDKPGFNFTHILYYLGGLIAIGAMTLFMTLGWERFGGSPCLIEFAPLNNITLQTVPLLINDVHDTLIFQAYPYTVLS